MRMVMLAVGALAVGALAVGALAGCAAAGASMCPPRSELRSLTTREGRAAWCTSRGRGLDVLPTGRTAAVSATMLQAPTAMPGGIDGPFTSWHPNGALASHGTYVDVGARSIPDGVWAFWDPDGHRRMLGTYAHGRAVGCFALWDEHGARVTGMPAGDQLALAACTPPDDAAIRIVEGTATPRFEPAWGDVAVVGFAGAAGIGARNAAQAHPDPRLAAAIGAVGRVHLGAWRLGATLGIRSVDDGPYRSFAGGAVAAYAVPAGRRLALELGAELGARYVSATPLEAGLVGAAPQTFWIATPALQVAAELRVTDLLHVVAAARAEGLPAYDVTRATRYCAYACGPPETETWQVGGVGVGAALGIRLVLR